MDVYLTHDRPHTRLMRGPTPCCTACRSTCLRSWHWWPTSSHRSQTQPSMACLNCVLICIWCVALIINECSLYFHSIDFHIFVLLVFGACEFLVSWPIAILLLPTPIVFLLLSLTCCPIQFQSNCREPDPQLLPGSHHRRARRAGRASCSAARCCPPRYLQHTHG